MERKSDEIQPMCRSGCGFYGNPATDGLCSICYKDSLKKTQQPSINSSLASVPSPQQPVENSDSSDLTPTISNTGETTLQQTSDDGSINEKSDSSAIIEKPEASTSDEQEDKDGSKDVKKKKNRCGMCRKKVGLTGFECRCGGLFCSVHRYHDEHNCTFDYREQGAQEIRCNNPVVVGEKIKKI